MAVRVHILEFKFVRRLTHVSFLLLLVLIGNLEHGRQHHLVNTFQLSKLRVDIIEVACAHFHVFKALLQLDKGRFRVIHIPDALTSQIYHCLLILAETSKALSHVRVDLLNIFAPIVIVSVELGLLTLQLGLHHTALRVLHASLSIFVFRVCDHDKGGFSLGRGRRVLPCQLHLSMLLQRDVRRWSVRLHAIVANFVIPTLPLTHATRQLLQGILPLVVSQPGSEQFF